MKSKEFINSYEYPILKCDDDIMLVIFSPEGAEVLSQTVSFTFVLKGHK